jgi:hypothetical protein
VCQLSLPRRLMKETQLVGQGPTKGYLDFFQWAVVQRWFVQRWLWSKKIGSFPSRACFCLSPGLVLYL